MEYLYGSDGNVAQIIDYAAGTRTKPVYDLAGRLVAVKQYDGTLQTDTDILTEFKYTYADKTNYLTEKTMDLPTHSLTATYTYGDAADGEMPDQVYNIYYDSWSSVDYAYDTLGRLTDETFHVAAGTPSTIPTPILMSMPTARRHLSVPTRPKRALMPILTMPSAT